MKNFKTGWITTLIGVLLIAFALLDFFGIIPVPAPEGLTPWKQIMVAFMVGMALLLLPASFLEEKLKDIVSKKTDSI